MTIGLIWMLAAALLSQSGGMDFIHVNEPLPVTIYYTPLAPASAARIEIDAPWSKIQVYELAIFDDDIVRLIRPPTAPGLLQLRIAEIFAGHLHEVMYLGVSMDTNFGRVYVDRIVVRLE